MIVGINRDGLMKIKAESHLEAYALKKWCEDNCSQSDNILFDYELDMKNNQIECQKQMGSLTGNLA
jgi:hypothetical protein